MKNKMSAQNTNAPVGQHPPVARNNAQVAHIHPNGLQASFKTLVVDQIPTLRRYAIALRGPIGDHDEIVRDTLEQAVKIKNTFAHDDDIRVWLLSILHDVYSAQYGNRMPTSSVIPLDISFDGMFDGSFDSNKAAHTNDKDLDMSDLEFALTLLPETHKEVFLLVSLEGLSYKQVSSILDKPVSSLMVQLTHARKLIKAIVSVNA